MIRNLPLIALVCLIAACSQQQQTPTKVTKQQRIQGAIDLEFERTYDPALGYVPHERLITAINETMELQKEMADRRSSSALSPKFIERGPTNVGGRTRAILIDLNDPERKAIFAGSVAGGLYKTEDITADPPNWQQVDDFLENLAVGSLAQDPQNPNIIYIGTGEGFPNADAVRGRGIFKSTDGGKSFDLLQSTDNSTFTATRNMVVHPTTGHVYAALSGGGVRRSEDGGETWIRVLGVGLTASNDNMYDLFYVGGKFYASNTTNIYSSETGDRGAWMDITRSGSGFPTNWSRTEFSVCGGDPNVIYAVGSISGGGSNVYRTQNGGTSWIDVGRPGQGDFTNGQAWYDLDIAVDPFNCNHSILGGVPIYRTNGGGNTWARFANNMHVDQHYALFDTAQQGVVYFGNDGGVYRSTNGSASNVSNRNEGYITSQYYACALHPDTVSNYMLGGTQDNGTHALDGPPPTEGRNVWGGDGFLCFIDQKDPDIQIVSSQFGNWGLSLNGGISFSGGLSTNGGFLCPADYDSDTKILYAQTRDGAFYRWNVLGSSELVQWSNLSAGVSTVTVDANIDNRVYFGVSGGRVIRVDDAHEGAQVETETLLAMGGTVSSVAVGHEAPEHLLATYSNYGISHSVMYSNDGGQTWLNCEGNLPDMPVRWAIFNPADPSGALIATETGVWSTDFLNGSGTVWEPPVPGEGTPIVRTDMLRIRESDFVVLAGTHGRGLWTSSVFAEPLAKFDAPQVHYIDVPLQFYGDVSLNATSYFWEFGDGTTSTEINPFKTYDEIGTYDVKLTINGDLSTSSQIKILPQMQLPYSKETSAYGGGFEGFEEQYGVEVTGGSKFERGSSNVPGKAGTKSGDYAMVLDPNSQFYEANTRTILYMPMFDFSDESIYTLSLWARYDLHPGPDGFNLEYTTDGGRTWRILSNVVESGWYNFNNAGVPNSAFPSNTSYFTSVVGGYTNYRRNVSFLSGNPLAAIRIVFRSEATGLHAGVAIDDFEITKFEGELQTALTSFTAAFEGDKDIEVKWATRPEYFCDRFELERSINGRDFEFIAEIDARGFVSDLENKYTYIDQGGRDLYFYRLKVISDDPNSDYYDEFYSQTITVRRRLEGIEVFNVFPNPFTDHVNITFTDRVDQKVFFGMYDASGRLVYEGEQVINDVFHRLELFQVPMGIYYLQIQIGEEDAKVYPMMGGTH